MEGKIVSSVSKYLADHPDLVPSGGIAREVKVELSESCREGSRVTYEAKTFPEEVVFVARVEGSSVEIEGYGTVQCIDACPEAMVREALLSLRLIQK